MVRRNKGLEFFRGRMVESKAEKGKRKRGKDLIDFKERKMKEYQLPEMLEWKMLQANL